jgi:hypothetical protein
MKNLSRAKDNTNPQQSYKKKYPISTARCPVENKE